MGVTGRRMPHTHSPCFQSSSNSLLFSLPYPFLCSLPRTLTVSNFKATSPEPLEYTLPSPIGPSTAVEQPQNEHTQNTHTHTNAHNTHTHIHTDTPASGRHLLLAETVCCCQTATRADWQKGSRTAHHSTAADKDAHLQHSCCCAEGERGRGGERGGERGGAGERKYDRCLTNIDKRLKPFITNTCACILSVSITPRDVIVHTASHQAVLGAGIRSTVHTSENLYVRRSWYSCCELGSKSLSPSGLMTASTGLGQGKRDEEGRVWRGGERMMW